MGAQPASGRDRRAAGRQAHGAVSQPRAVRRGEGASAARLPETVEGRGGYVLRRGRTQVQRRRDPGDCWEAPGIRSPASRLSPPIAVAARSRSSRPAGDGYYLHRRRRRRGRRSLRTLLPTFPGLQQHQNRISAAVTAVIDKRPQCRQRLVQADDRAQRLAVPGRLRQDLHPAVSTAGQEPVRLPTRMFRPREHPSS
jgi:hypothetical protein